MNTAHNPAGRNPGALATIALLAIAIALRCWDYGNPIIHVDEQYYLLVGDRLLHGAVPYLDIWDRKPIGLFLLFAGIRMLPGDGVLAYQLVATLFALATAWIIHGSARHLGASRVGAFAAAVAYLLWLPLLGGRGGQAPVFYNLLIVAATRLTLHLPGYADSKRPAHAILINGLVVCLVGGIAIQLKYTAAVEAAYLGTVHLWYLYRSRARLIIVAAGAAAWIIAGLLPTLAVIAGYAAIGPAALHAFWFANFTSIGLRPGYPWGELAMRLLGIGATLLPLIVAAALAWRSRARTGIERDPQRIALGELSAAVLGFLAIGTFFNHYALPLIAPFCILGAPALGRSRKLLITTLAIGLAIFTVERVLHPGDDRDGARAVARIVRANSAGGCPYVFIGDTITYELADTCLPTEYVFPNFLAYTTEQGAMGIDEAGEVKRILADKPPVIVTSTRRLTIWNRASLAELKTALAAHYRPVFSVPRDRYRTIVYLRDGRPFRDAAR